MKLLLLFLICVSLFPGCSKTDNKSKLVIYFPRKEMLLEFEKQFEAIHLDIDVQWLDMGSQEVFDRIRTEKGKFSFDIWWGAPSTIFSES
ncbi:MAG: hypothetical protein IPP52_11560 [Ignavibacteria bacterium]|nr:hypothetical protein [Ignavibacteria bacterium]